MQLSSHQRVEDKNISKDAHLLGAGLDIQRDDILGYENNQSDTVDIKETM
ncbi:hypothetical protein SATMO3_27010 [Sporomusa aerivorans]